MNANTITGLRYADHLNNAEFKVEVIPNQGSGAAAYRGCATVFPKCWFNEATTESGRDALGYYHEKKDEARDVGLGPEHDWSSHAADAFGLMAIKYEEPSRMANFHRKIVYPQLGIVGNKAGNRTFDGLSVLG
jgi:phage terminase large subunit